MKTTWEPTKLISLSDLEFLKMMSFLLAGCKAVITQKSESLNTFVRERILLLSWCQHYNILNLTTFFFHFILDHAAMRALSLYILLMKFVSSLNVPFLGHLLSDWNLVYNILLKSLFYFYIKYITSKLYI